MAKVKYVASEVLNIQPGDTEKDIKRKYKMLIRKYTPEHDPEKFMEIRDAYDSLANFNLSRKPSQTPIYKEPYLFIMNEEKKIQIDPKEKTNLLGKYFESPFDINREIKELIST